MVLFAIISGLVAAGNGLIDTNLDKQEGATEDLRGWMDCFRSTKFWLLCYCVFGKCHSEIHFVPSQW